MTHRRKGTTDLSRRGATRRGRATRAGKGRGTVWAIEHRFTRRRARATTTAGARSSRRRSEERLAPETEVIEESVKSILASNDSPDIRFDLSINPYRGCEHGCIYCFARPTHSYLNLSPGLDFETRIIAKVNAAERLREAFARRGYQPQRRSTSARRPTPTSRSSASSASRASVIEVLAECAHPFSLVTKSSGVERDLDLIAPMAAQRPGGGLRLGHLARSGARAHPRAARGGAAPAAAARSRRWRGRRAGGVSVSPIIPFINEPEIERILEAAAAAGARRRSASSCACRGR